jgi:hypothetical protein
MSRSDVIYAAPSGLPAAAPMVDTPLLMDRSLEGSVPSEVRGLVTAIPDVRYARWHLYRVVA